MTNPAHIDPFAVVYDLALASCGYGRSFCQTWVLSRDGDVW